MAVSTLLAQARAGNATAIAQLMNQQFHSRGVTIQASRTGNCLQLRLEGDPLLTQQGFIAYVDQALRRLGCPIIERVEIVAIEWGQAQPLWQSSLNLVNTATPQRELVMAGAIGKEPVQTRARAGAKSAIKAPSQQAVFAPSVPAGAPNDSFEADVAALASQAAEETAPTSTSTAWQYRGGSVAEPEVKRLPLPSRSVIARQWFMASLLGTLATLGITAVISALLIPVVASMTGMEQLTGFAVAILLAMQLIIGIPIAGLVIGYAQTRMLRRYLRTVGGWLLITPLGCLIGFFIAIIVHFVGQSALNLAGWANSLGQAQSLTGELLSLGCTTLGVGLGFGFLGLAQFAILSGRLRRAQRWIGVMGLSGMAAWLVAGGLFKLISPALDGLARTVNMTPMMLGGILAAIAAWLVFQSLSSFSMALLLRPQENETKLG